MFEFAPQPVKNTESAIECSHARMSWLVAGRTGHTLSVVSVQGVLCELSTGALLSIQVKHPHVFSLLTPSSLVGLRRHVPRSTNSQKQQALRSSLRR